MAFSFGNYISAQASSSLALKMPMELSECHLLEVYITKEVSILKALPDHFCQWLMEQQEGKD